MVGSESKLSRYDMACMEFYGLDNHHVESGTSNKRYT